MGGPVSGSLMKLQSSSRLGMQWSEALTGAGRSVSKEARSCVKAGIHSSSLTVGWKFYFLTMWASPSGCLIVFKTWQLDSSRMMSDCGWGLGLGRERTPEMEAAVFYNLISEGTSSLLLYAIGHVAQL